MNLRHLTECIISCYTHKMAIQYRDRTSLHPMYIAAAKFRIYGPQFYITVSNFVVKNLLQQTTVRPTTRHDAI